jgi:hypothetical protein
VNDEIRELLAFAIFVFFPNHCTQRYFNDGVFAFFARLVLAAAIGTIIGINIESPQKMAQGTDTFSGNQVDRSSPATITTIRTSPRLVRLTVESNGTIATFPRSQLHMFVI